MVWLGQPGRLEERDGAVPPVRPTALADLEAEQAAHAAAVAISHEQHPPTWLTH